MSEEKDARVQLEKGGGGESESTEGMEREMETDVPKGWNRERGGLNRNHKRFPGKKWENGEGED